jgi:hypothetical protein
MALKAASKFQFQEHSKNRGRGPSALAHQLIDVRGRRSQEFLHARAHAIDLGFVNRGAGLGARPRLEKSRTMSPKA